MVARPSSIAQEGACRLRCNDGLGGPGDFSFDGGRGGCGQGARAARLRLDLDVVCQEGRGRVGGVGDGVGCDGGGGEGGVVGGEEGEEVVGWLGGHCYRMCVGG